MRSFTALRLGLRLVHRRPGLVVLAWLAALLPALLLASIVYQDAGAAMNDSLFAEQALEGNRYGVWTDFSSSPDHDLGALGPGMLLRLLLVLVIQALVSAGIVETLLGVSPRAMRPFLLGIGRHGWRFLRSAVWFLLSVAVLVLLVGAYIAVLRRISEEASNAALHLWGSVGGLAIAALIFAVLDLAYDLARISGAAHYDGRTLKGYLLALGHTLRRAGVLMPLWLIFVGGGLLTHVLYLTMRDRWSPANGVEVALLLVVGQLLLLLRAYLRVGLWGAEVAYYQGIGEPRWSIRGSRPRPAPPQIPREALRQPDTEPILSTPPVTARGEGDRSPAGSGPAGAASVGDRPADDEPADWRKPEPEPADAGPTDADRSERG